MKFFSLLSLLCFVRALPGKIMLVDRKDVTETPRGPLKLPASNPTMSRPTPRLVTYVQTFTTPDKQALSLLPLLKHETKVTHVILAATHLQKEPGNITLNDDPFDAAKYDVIWEEVKTLQQNGIKVMALLGGAAVGTYLRLSGTNEEFNTYYRPLLSLIQKYNLDGLDIDIEEKVDVTVPLRLLDALYQDMGPSFILTMAPMAAALADDVSGYNPSGFSYLDLERLATVPGSEGRQVSWYNAMFYGGFARSTSFYKSCVDAGWDPGRLVMGVLDCADEEANGFVNITTLHKTIRDLKGMYGGIGGVAGWEYYNAGATDLQKEPWEWLKSIGEVLF